MTAGEPVVRARGVAVARAGVEVVRDVDLALAAGEVVVLIGPNGAGKSTLLAALAGLLPATRGTVERRGRVAAALQAPALAQRTARANVEAALAWWGVARRDRRDRALAALHAMGARALADRPARALSGGEARRVHLARALALEADALLLDEPFAGLDAPTRAELLYDAASALRDTRRATLVVVHDRAEAWALADRVLVMLDGRVAADGPPVVVFGSPPTPEVANSWQHSIRLMGPSLSDHRAVFFGYSLQTVIKSIRFRDRTARLLTSLIQPAGWGPLPFPSTGYCGSGGITNLSHHRAVISAQMPPRLWWVHSAI